MNILVLVKPVAPRSVEGVRLPAEMSVNMADGAAVSFARKQSELGGGVSVLLSLSPLFPHPSLVSLKSQGFSAVYQICDPIFAGSDTLATTRVLARAITCIERKMNLHFSVIACGNRSTDSETAQVPSQLAAVLGLPVATNCLSAESSEQGWTVVRLFEKETCTFLYPFHCVLSFCPKGSEIDPPSLAGLANMDNVPFIRLTSKELHLEKGETGLKGSASQVVTLRQLAKGLRNPVFIKNPAEGALAIWKQIKIEHSRHDAAPVDVAMELKHICWNNDAYVVCPVEDCLAWETGLQVIGKLTKLGYFVQAIVFCKSLSTKIRSELAVCGCRLIIHNGETDLTDEQYAQIVVSYVRHKQGIVLFGATVRMRSAASICAAKLSAGLCADCTDITVGPEGQLHFIRPAFGESVEADIVITTSLALATIRHNAFPRYRFKNYQEAVLEYTFTAIPSQVQRLTSVPIEENESETEDIIFSIGDGVEEASLRNRIFAFGFAKGASRMAINHYAIPYRYQVGLTGKLVTPYVYVAFGISGSEQHLVGIKQAKVIIAVNTDCLAPIFAYSDIAICCDVGKVVTALEKLKEADDEL
jgi:electron transfer flavoprotein alpha subunit